jgi:hypothetical protein
MGRGNMGYSVTRKSPNFFFLKKWHAYGKRLEASHYKKLQALAIIYLKFFANLSIGAILHPQTLISLFFNFPFSC